MLNDITGYGVMANTYSALHYHLVFSTRNRLPHLTPEIEGEVWAYIGGVARKHHMKALEVGGFDDHIHVLVMAPPALAPSQIAQYLKGDSSRWIHENFPALVGSFAWQEGYAIFTVSQTKLESVARYIRNQRRHHQQRTFQDEYRDFLQKQGVEYDERYIWG
jgi:REP element-mobilizing transposase RayT